MKKPLADKIFAVLWLAAVGLLLYLLGMAGVFYQWYPAEPVGQTLHTLTETQKDMTGVTVAKDELDTLLAQKKVTWDKDLADNGYTLLTVRYASDVLLVDMQGNIVHRWHVPYYSIWDRSSRRADEDWIYMEKALAFTNGDLLVTYTAANDTPYGYGIAKIDKDAKLIWKYNGNTHHDITIDPDTGNIVALTQRFTKKGEKPYEVIPFPTLEDFAVILSPDGNELDRISILDAFYHSPYRLLLNDYNKNELDWDRTHTNSVEVLSVAMAAHFPQFAPGQILISLRNIDTIAVLDPKTRRIVWAFNGIWRGQHSPQFLANGHILLLDNKGHVENHKIYSRVLEFNPTTLGVEWSYPITKEQYFFTDSFGRVQRLENGNTLVTDAMNGHILEVTAEGKQAWEYRIPLLSRRSNRVVDKAVHIQGDMKYYMEEPLIFDPAITGMIISASRYKESQLPFLKE